MILCLGPTPAVQRVMRFSRLTLNEVNRAETTLEGAAGKSVNVAKVLHRLGEQVTATGFLGGDRGERVREVLRHQGVNTEFVMTTVPTRECVTVIDVGAGLQTELVEESLPVEVADYERLFRMVEQRVGKARAIVMSGTLTPGGPEEFYARCAWAASDAGGLTVVDAKGAPLIEALAARVGLVKPNQAELAVTVGRELPDENEVKVAMAELRERGAERVVVTAGRAATVACDGRQFWRITPPEIRAINPIGSGDAATAGIVWRLLRGDDLGEACRWGTAVGAANALNWMAGEVEVEQVEALVNAVQLERC